MAAAGASGDLAYTVGYEHMSFSVDGVLVEPWTLRVTHLYRREDGEWKTVRRHTDAPPVDQPPPADAPPDPAGRGTLPDVEADEGPLERLGWRALAAAGRVVGPRVARRAAAVVLRARAGSDDGWLEGVHRVATRPAPGAPSLTRLPGEWWTASPVVPVRRLGLRLELDLRDNLQRILYATGTYEPAVLRFLRQELRPGDVVVDVGAHVGVHALTAAALLRRLGGGTVVAFEPAHDSAAKLRAGAARNRVELTVVEAALGGEPGTADLRTDPTYDPFDAGVRSLHGRGARTQTVPVTTFDAWAAETRLDRLDLVKLDVEGSELEALEGMTASLRRLRPRALVVEVKQRILDRAEVNSRQIHSLLSQLGYEPTGQALPVANALYRPTPGRTRP